MQQKKKPKRTKSPRVTRPLTTDDICFTIMPYGGWFDDYYETIYCPAIEDAGLNPKRADDLYRPSTIVTDIWTYTQQAKLVLADLSGKNPNVFYELGLAHALAKPAILITESIDDVPFDLRALRVIEYNKNEPRWGDRLQESIKQSIKEVLSAPLQSVLPAFLAVKHEQKTKAVSEQEISVLQLKREIDLLRNEMIHSNRPYRRDIGPEQAKARIDEYIRRGMPSRIIVNRLVDFGVPREWVEKRLDELKKEDKSRQEFEGKPSDTDVK